MPKNYTLPYRNKAAVYELNIKCNARINCLYKMQVDPIYHIKNDTLPYICSSCSKIVQQKKV